MSKNATLRSLQTRLICRNSRARFPSRFCRSEAKAAQSCPGFFWMVPTYPSRGSSKAKAKTAAFSERGSGGMSERAGREPRLRRSALLGVRSAGKLGEGSPSHRARTPPRAPAASAAPLVSCDTVLARSGVRGCHTGARRPRANGPVCMSETRGAVSVRYGVRVPPRA